MKHYLGTAHQTFPYNPFPQKVLEMEMEEADWYKVIVYHNEEGYILDTVWDSESWDRNHFEGIDPLKRLLESIKYEPIIEENENVGNYMPAWVFFQPHFVKESISQKIKEIILDYMGGIDESKLKPQERKSLQEWKGAIAIL